MSQQTQSNVTRLTQPSAGMTVNVPIDADNMKLGLGFQPDPNAVQKNGQNLEFSFEDGGKLVLEGYYNHFTNKTLPIMVTEAGDELPGEDFLASLREDLLTAAGPGAGAGAAGGGAGEYADDPGALIDGVDRLGSLGTIYWDRATEVTEEFEQEVAALSVTLAFVSTAYPPVEIDENGWITGRFVNVVFEDGLPNQHLQGGRYDFASAQMILDTYGIQVPDSLQNKTPGILEIGVEADGTTRLTGLDLSGFTVGSIIMIGDTVIEITSVDQVVSLTPAQVAGFVAVYPPSDNSDADMNITITAYGQANNGNTATDTQVVILVVDAVADLPEAWAFGGEMETAYDIFGYRDADGNVKYFNDINDVLNEFGSVLPDGYEWLSGWKGITDEQHQTSGKHKGYDSLEADTVTLPFSAEFDDYLDGSEVHTITISGVPSTWELDLTQLPEGLTAADVTRGENGEYIINVPVGANGVGSVDGAFIFKPGDWTNERNHDGTERGADGGPATITITTSADEVGNATSGQEATLANNHAETSLTYFVSIDEDKPEFVKPCVTIKADEGSSGKAVLIALKGLTHDSKDILDAIDTPDAKPIAVSSVTIKYDLHSDGDTDGRDLTPDNPDAIPGSALTFVGDNVNEPGAASPVACGWQTTAGEDIFLFSGSNGQDAYIEGRTADGTLAFVIIADGNFKDGVNSGQVSFIQYESLKHADGKGENWLKGLNVQLEIRDADGDTDIMRVNFAVQDDVPKISCQEFESVFEHDLRGDGVIAFTKSLAVDFGADGPHADTPVFWDADAVTAEATFYQALVNGRVEDLKAFVDGDTFEFRTADDVVVVRGTLNIDADGNVSYTYEQFHTLNHTNTWGGLPGEIVKDFKKLDLKYTIMDGDGDPASGKIAVTVIDDGQHLTKPDLLIVDETYTVPGGPVTMKIENLDYKAGDGIIPAEDANGHQGNIEWSVAAINLALTHISATEFPGKDLVASLGSDPKVLEIRTEDGELILTLTLGVDRTGDYSDWRYTITYDQDHALQHKIPGLAHNDPLPLLLTVVTTDGDGDKMINLIDLTVLDDGPCFSGASNVAIMETIVNSMIENAGSIDFSDPAALIASLTKAMGNVAMDALGDTAAMLDLVDLVLNTNLARFDGQLGVVQSIIDAVTEAVKEDDNVDIGAVIQSVIDSMSDPAGFINALIKDVPGYDVEFKGDLSLSDLAILTQLGTDLTKNPIKFLGIGGDTDRTEGNGPIEGILTVNFGADGPAKYAENITGWNLAHAGQDPAPVGWNALGVQGMFHLLGVRSTLDPDAMLFVRSACNSIPPTILEVTAGQDGPVAMTLTLTYNNDGTATYSIDLAAGLVHDASVLSELIANVLQGVFDSDMLAQIPNAQGIIDTINALKALGIDVTPEGLIAALGKGNLLTLPLPITIMDGDGDITGGVISVTIRDSVPTIIDAGDAAIVYENDLLTDDGAFATGILTISSFDGVDEIWMGNTLLYKHGMDLGDIKAGALYGDVEILSVTHLGNGKYEIEYKYTLDNALDHKDPLGNPLANENTELQVTPDQPGPEQFDLRIVDSEGDDITATVDVTIVDGIPYAYSESDTMDTTVSAGHEVDGISWGATGNILDPSDGRVTQDGAKPFDKDTFGPDGPAEENALVIKGFDENGNAKEFSLTGDDWTTVYGQYGVLYIKADGEYEYVADPAKLSEATTKTVEVPGDAVTGGAYTNHLPWQTTDKVTSLEFGSIGNQTTQNIDLGNLINIFGWKPLAGYSYVQKVTPRAEVSYYDAEGNLLGQYYVTADANGSWELPKDASGNYPFDLQLLDHISVVADPLVESGIVPELPASLQQYLSTITKFVDGILGEITIQPGEVTGGETVVYTEISLPYPEEVFEYVLKDHDGDQAKATLTIDTTPPAQVDPGTLVVDETFIPVIGSGVDTDGPGDASSHKATGNFDIGADEFKALTVAAAETAGGQVKDIRIEEGTITVYGEYGELTITAAKEGDGWKVTYTYEQKTAFMHDDDPAVNTGDQKEQGETFGFKVGGFGVGDLTVEIEDDAPVLEFGAAPSLENPEGIDVISGEHAPGGTIEHTFAGMVFTFGADDQAVTAAVVLSRDGADDIIGVWDKDAGLWTFSEGEDDEKVVLMTLDPKTGDVVINVPAGADIGDHDWTITLKDKDGDTASDTIRFTVQSNPFKDFDPFVVDESYLNNANAVGTLAGQEAAAAEGTPLGACVQTAELTQAQLNNLSISLDGTTKTMAITGTVGVGYSGKLTGEYGELEFKAVWNEETGRYDVTTTYTLTDNFNEHADNAAHPDATGRDADGNQPAVYKPGTGEPDDWNESTADGLVGNAKPDAFTFKVGTESASVGTEILDDGLGLPGMQAFPDMQIDVVPEFYNLVLTLDLSGSMLYRASSDTTGNSSSISPTQFYNYYAAHDNDPSTNPIGNGSQAPYAYESTRMYQTQVAMLEMLEAYYKQVGDDGTVSLLGFSGLANSVEQPVDRVSHLFTNGDGESVYSISDAITLVKGMFSPLTLEKVGNDWVVQYNFNGQGGIDSWTKYYNGSTQFNLWGNTNWEVALDESMTLINNALQQANIEAGQYTRFYFFSDGAPNTGDTSLANETGGASWRTYLKGLVDNDYFELHSVGLKGVESSHFNKVITPKDSTDTLGTHHDIPDDMGLDSFISELIGSMADYTAHINLPVAADGVVIQGGQDPKAADYDDTPRAFVHEVTLSLVGADSKAVPLYYTGEEPNRTPVYEVTGTIGTIDANGFPHKADGSLSVEEGSFVLFNTEYGSFMFRADGTFTFTANKGYNALEQDLNFKFSVTFMDGDGDTLKVDYNVEVPMPPATPEVSAVLFDGDVYEMALLTGTFDGTDEERADLLTTTGKAIITCRGGLSEISVAGVEIDLTGWDPSTGAYIPAIANIDVANGYLTNVKIAYVDGKYVLTFDYVLTENTLAHSEAGADRLSEGDAAAQAAMPEIVVTATSKAGGIESAMSGKIDIVDDTPDNIGMDGKFHNQAETELNGVLVDMGADSEGRVEFTAIDGDKVSNWQVGDEPVYFRYPNPGDTSVVEGYLKSSGDTVFTIIGNSDGTYTFNQIMEVNGPRETILPDPIHYSTAGINGGQPTTWYVTEAGKYTKAEELGGADWIFQIKGENNQQGQPGANLSNGIGVGNANFDSKERLVINVDREARAGAIDQKVNLIASMIFDFSDFEGKESVSWTAVYKNAAGDSYPDSGTFYASSTADYVVPVHGQPGEWYIDTITLTAGADTKCKLLVISTVESGGEGSVVETPLDALTVPYTAHDGDGDYIPSNGEFTLTPSDSGNMSAADATEGVALASGDAGVGETFTLVGSDFDDVLTGGDGDDLIYGGKGDDIMFGGDGHDTFAWMAGDLDGGHDKIMDFQLNADLLLFESLMPNAGELDVAALVGNILKVSALDGNTVQLEVNDGNGSVNVEIHFQGDSPAIADVTAFNGNDAQALAMQQQLLEQMIKSETGN